MLEFVGKPNNPIESLEVLGGHVVCYSISKIPNTRYIYRLT